MNGTTTTQKLNINKSLSINELELGQTKIYGGKYVPQKYNLGIEKKEFLSLFGFSKEDIEKFLNDPNQTLAWDGLRFSQFDNKLWIYSKEFSLGTCIASTEINAFTGKITLVFSNESLKNLFCEILAHEKLPSAKFFFDKIGKPDPGMPHLNELRQEKEKEERIRKEALKFAEENNKDLSSVLSGSPPSPKSSDRVLPVIQREARIATGDDYLSTFGAGPCLILMIYDPVTNTSALAHIDGVTTPESINLLINRFQNKDKLEISIVSGEINVFSKVYSVIKKNELVNRIVRLSVDLYDERADAVVFYQGKVYEFNPLYEKPQNDPIYKNKESLKRAIDIFSRGMVFSSSPLTIRVTPPKQ